MKLGITGLIGSGKSTVAAILAQIGVPIYDSDARAKALMVGAALRPELERILGTEAYTPQGALNRAWVAERIFGDRGLKQSLEAVVHPVVVADFEHWAATVDAPRGWVGVESALLIESGLFRAVDAVLWVEAPEALRVERTVARDRTSPQAVRERMAHQISSAQGLRYATWVLHADGRALEPEVVRLFDEKISTFVP